MLSTVLCSGREKVQVGLLLLSLPSLYSLVMAACLSADSICKPVCSASSVPPFQGPGLCGKGVRETAASTAAPGSGAASAGQQHAFRRAGEGVSPWTGKTCSAWSGTVCLC